MGCCRLPYEWISSSHSRISTRVFAVTNPAYNIGNHRGVGENLDPPASTKFFSLPVFFDKPDIGATIRGPSRELSTGASSSRSNALSVMRLALSLVMEPKEDIEGRVRCPWFARRQEEICCCIELPGECSSMISDPSKPGEPSLAGSCCTLSAGDLTFDARCQFNCGSLEPRLIERCESKGQPRIDRRPSG